MNVPEGQEEFRFAELMHAAASRLAEFAGGSCRRYDGMAVRVAGANRRRIRSTRTRGCAAPT